MRALINFIAALAMMLAVPGVVRLSADDDQRPAAETVAPSGQEGTSAIAAGRGTAIQTETGSTVAAPPSAVAVPATAAATADPATPPAETVKEAIVAPVKRMQPKTPAIVDAKAVDETVDKPKAVEGGKSTDKKASAKKPAKKARVSRAETGTKKR